jgi:hypothetical protein
MTSSKIPNSSRTTRKRGKNSVSFPKGIKTRISMIHINEHQREILDIPAISVQMSGFDCGYV